MLLETENLTIVNSLQKSITRSQAKSVHKELPPGGNWVTIRGHHVYVKDGKVLAGSIPGASGNAKKATKAHLAEHQAHVDGKAKGGKTDDKKGKSKTSGRGKSDTGNTDGKPSKRKPASTSGKGVPAKTTGRTAKKDEEVKPKAKAKATASKTKTPAKTTKGEKSSGSKKAVTTGTGKPVSKRTKKGASEDGNKKSAPAKPTKPAKARSSKGTDGASKPGDGTKAGKPKTTKTAGANARSGKDDGADVRGAKQTAKDKKPAGKGSAKASTKKEVKDIRTEAQKNRNLAYDVGEKIGGAKKDTYQRDFYQTPTIDMLRQLEKESPVLAKQAVTKQNVLKPVDFEAEYKRGTDINTASLKHMIYGRIAPKPSEDTKEAREAYLNGINQLHRILSPIKSWDDMRSAVSDLSSLARRGKQGRDADFQLARDKTGVTYFNTEHYTEASEKGKEARGQLDFQALGEKLENFFTDFKARVRTLDTIKKKGLTWEQYLTPEAKEVQEKEKPKRGDKKAKWERMAVSEHQRKGGKETPVKKPEDMVKHFGMKGVEFGHYVDDSSGLYHLKRSAEAFHDLADILGIDDKDISLNGRLSMAFGARGKGGALAHYEPASRVINMTKHGGAGSLAHEWGHALDNILYAYSHKGEREGGFGSAGNMGDHDPILQAAYENVMDAIKKPVPGQPGATKKLTIDSSAKMMLTQLPGLRRDIEGGMSTSEAYSKWHKQINDSYDRNIAIIQNNRMRSPDDIAKRVKSEERKRTADLNSLPHWIAGAKRALLPGNGYRTGEHYKEEIEVPTGNSEYFQRMQEMDGGGKGYYAKDEEMFARAFESYVEDKMSDKKRMNNYLVWDTKTKREGAPFPVAAERDYIKSAMDDLIEYIATGGTLKKAIEMDLLKSIEPHPLQRNAYLVPHDVDPDDVIYIPVNRLQMIYQTDAATNWDKVQSNVDSIKAGQPLYPVEIGYDHDIHDGHHRWLATQAVDYSHVPCVVKGQNPLLVEAAKERYREMWL